MFNYSNLKICVVGSGAVGSVVAARLSNIVNNLNLLSRGANLKKISQSGIRLTTHSDVLKSKNLVLHENFNSMGEQDLIILAVKANQISSLIPQINLAIGNKTTIITMQNGIPFWYFEGLKDKKSLNYLNSVDPDGLAMSNFDSNKIIGSVVYMAAELTSPGEVFLIEDKKLPFGEIKGAVKTKRLELICNIFVDAGFRSPMLKNIRNDIWIKLWGNCTFNPISALTHSTLEEICESQDTKNLIFNMMKEVKLVGEYFGAKFGISEISRIQGAKSVGNHKTSMLQDVENGKEFELDALLGSVIELAASARISVPHLTSVYSCCQLLNRTLLKKNSFLKIS